MKPLQKELLMKVCNDVTTVRPVKKAMLSHLVIKSPQEDLIDDDDNDCFYIALFSALEQTHCACM